MNFLINLKAILKTGISKFIKNFFTFKLKEKDKERFLLLKEKMMKIEHDYNLKNNEKYREKHGTHNLNTIKENEKINNICNKLN